VIPDTGGGENHPPRPGRTDDQDDDQLDDQDDDRDQLDDQDDDRDQDDDPTGKDNADSVCRLCS
jgi:hypothetical protein